MCVWVMHRPPVYLTPDLMASHEHTMFRWREGKGEGGGGGGGGGGHSMEGMER